MSSAQTQASLIIATAELKAVQSVIGAIRKADQAAQANGGWNSPAAFFEPRLHIHPTPVYESRPHYHPTPIYADHPVIHPHPRVEQMDLSCPCPCPCHPPPMKLENPIQAPWKVLPWENMAPPRQTVKILPIHTDVVHKGTVLDLFV